MAEETRRSVRETRPRATYDADEGERFTLPASSLDVEREPTTNRRAPRAVKRA